MEKHDLVLNLHGEMISTPASAVGKQADPVVTVLNAEPLFIPQLAKLHKAFPKLRIILEHVSTRQGLEAVRACGPNVCTKQSCRPNVFTDLFFRLPGLSQVR
jgi:dihydroorotase